MTVPVDAHAESGHDTICGYRNAGTRAIRIDMLERLADMLRGENSRTGFEAKADMLSITGMTLEQFVDLMQGLGYQAVKGVREKTKAAQDPVGGVTREVDQPEISAVLSEKEAFEPVDVAQEAALDINLAKVAPRAVEALSSGSERIQAPPQEKQRAASTAQADSQSTPAQSQGAETVAPEKCSTHSLGGVWSKNRARQDIINQNITWVMKSRRANRRVSKNHRAIKRAPKSLRLSQKKRRKLIQITRLQLL